MKTKVLATAAATVAGSLLVVVLVLLILIYTGAYNVSAAAGHSAIGRWALETMMRNSVESRAEGKAPQEFTPEMMRAGAGEYKSMCQHCHGGPGVSRAEWAKGIVPRPPDLSRAATRWSASEIHWIVKNGIKMSAMPSFGTTHDDRTVWSITAFVKQLPAMTPETYAAFPSGHGDGGNSGGGHSQGGHE